MSYGEQLLSKILDTNDPGALTRFAISEEHFSEPSDRAAYRFIREYAEANRNQAPDYRTVSAEVEGFTYVPEVGDSLEWLADNLKKRAAHRMYYDYFSRGEFERVFNGGDPEAIEKSLAELIEKVRTKTDSRKKIGVSVKEIDAFLSEYRRRKEGQSFKIWRSKFERINEIIGGYISGNMYTVFGKSGRGKSVITLEESIQAAMDGANVLIWSMEMPWYEVMVRIYVSISGRNAVVPKQYIDDELVSMDAGFNARHIQRGKLSAEFEEGFTEFLRTINEVVPGNIYVRGVDHEDFNVRNLRQLEADILATNADVVMVDPFYYLDYEKNTSKTTGGDAAETSKKLRRLAGKTQTVIFAITQADEVKGKEDDEGNRELAIPDRSEVVITQQLLRDAANLIAIDTLTEEGRGVIGIGKGRDGGEGERCEIVYLPNYGLVKQMDEGEAMANQFVSQF